MQPTRIEKLLEFLSKEPGDPFLKYALATEYVSMNDTGTALTYYEDLIQNHPDYVGTYYHLAKLYEALGRRDDAVTTYQQGMQAARNARDQHAFSELQAAYQACMGLDYEDD